MNIENNKLIVNFMGLEPIEGLRKFSIYKDYILVNCETKEEALDSFCENTKYHISWHWLKPVIDAIIKSIGIKTVDECTEEEWFQYTRITQMYIGVDIALAYHYVIEYLKWYNNQKLIIAIEEGEIDTDELKTDFNEYLYSKGYDFETVINYTDEHFENLLSFEENKRKFIIWYNN